MVPFDSFVSGDVVPSALIIDWVQSGPLPDGIFTYMVDFCGKIYMCIMDPTQWAQKTITSTSTGP